MIKTSVFIQKTGAFLAQNWVSSQKGGEMRVVSGINRKWFFCLVVPLLAAAANSPTLALSVIFQDSFVDVYTNQPDGAMENPATVRGYTVSEFRDADSGALPDWTKTGSVDGSSSQAWLRDSTAEVTTTTTVESSIIAIHLQGDHNDGLADIYVDGVLKATLDMFHTPSTNNVFVIVRGLSNTTHTIRVDDMGAGSGSGDDVAVWGASALTATSVTVNFTAANVNTFTELPDSAMEDPNTVQGIAVTEFRDADSGGAPDWGSAGFVQGSSVQAWLRDSTAEINTTTTVVSDRISVHLQGDNNDGVADIYVDGMLKARLDMFESSGTNNVQLLIGGLSLSTHVIVVDDIGPGAGGPSSDDVAAWGAAVLMPVCGNNAVDLGETCDGTDLDGETCQSLGFIGGTLACDPDCLDFDTSGCFDSCGDGIIGPSEICDGMNLDGETCQSLGFGGGMLACEVDCLTFDTSDCTTCGNNFIDLGETCDGTDLGGETCLSLGFRGGELECEADCLTFDTSGCTNPVPALSRWGVVILIAVLSLLGISLIRRRRMA